MHQVARLKVCYFVPRHCILQEYLEEKQDYIGIYQINVFKKKLQRSETRVKIPSSSAMSRKACSFRASRQYIIPRTVLGMETKQKFVSLKSDKDQLGNLHIFLLVSPVLLNVCPRNDAQLRSSSSLPSFFNESKLSHPIRSRKFFHSSNNSKIRLH